MTKFIITGASGYIGGYVADLLAEEGHEVFAPVRPGSSFSANKNINVFENDLWDLRPETWREIANGSTLIHLAWQDGFDHNADSHLANLENHINFVNNLVEFGISRFVGVGSMHELGPISGLVSENIEPKPVNQYGLAKNEFRKSTQFICQNNLVSYLWLRCFYITGDDHKNNSVFSKMLQMESNSMEQISLTSGNAKFDFIDVSELAYLISATSADSNLNGVLNLGSGNIMTLRERIELFKSQNNLKLSLKFGEFPERVGIGEGAWPDLTRLKSYLHQNKSQID